MTSTALTTTTAPDAELWAAMRKADSARLAEAIAEAAEVAHRGADVDARRSGSVPAAVRRLAPNTCRQRGLGAPEIRGLAGRSPPAIPCRRRGRLRRAPLHDG